MRALGFLQKQGALQGLYFAFYLFQLGSDALEILAARIGKSSNQSQVSGFGMERPAAICQGRGRKNKFLFIHRYAPPCFPL